MNLPKAALDRPVTTLMIFACFVVVGIISGQVLPLEFMPDLTVPFMGVDIPYPGSTPEEVERRITQPAEEVLATISGIKRMNSYSHENGVWIEMEFDWGTDSDIKALEAREKLDPGMWTRILDRELVCPVQTIQRPGSPDAFQHLLRFGGRDLHLFFQPEELLDGGASVFQGLIPGGSR